MTTNTANIAPGQSVAQAPVLQYELANRLPSHIPALDGIRGLAVLLVLFCHAAQRPFGEGADVNLIYTGAIDRLILTAARLSWTGVDMFFVLSGFLITGILFDAKGKDHFFLNFYARRTVRIFPLYYAALVLYLIVWPQFPAWMSEGFGTIPTSQVWYWLYLSNYSQSLAEEAGRVTTHPLHVSWSLSIEEQFYLVWPLVVFLCSRKTLLKLTLVMFFGSMIVRSGFLYADKVHLAILFTPCRVDGLAVGAAIALIARGPLGLRSLVKPAWIIGPASAAAIAAMVVLMYKLGYRRGIGYSPGYITVGTALFALLYGSLLVLTAAAAKGSLFHWTFTHPIFRILGKYSYAIYLLHLPIMILTAEWVFKPDRFRIGPTILPGLILFSAVTWTLAVLVAWISWHVLEKHFLKLKDYFPTGGKPAIAAAVPAPAQT